MKRRNSVFNNYNSGKYSSSLNKNRNGLLNTHHEFARDFFLDEKEECEEVRKKSDSSNEQKGKNNQKKS